MHERTISPAESFGAPTGGGIFDDPGAPAGNATVSAGVYTEQLPVGNSSVGEIRARFADRFDIHPASQAILDGHDVGDEVVVRPGQFLVFAHRSGEKGAQALPRAA